MARAAKRTMETAPAAPPVVTRKRLTPEQKAAIAEGLAQGEKGASLAARMGVSIATIYQQKKKLNAFANERNATFAPITDLQKRLIVWASRKLLDRSVDADETAELKGMLQAEIERRFEEGLTG